MESQPAHISLDKLDDLLTFKANATDLVEP